MSDALFSSLLRDSENRQRHGGVAGLRYGEVVEITPEGYVLEWLSGDVRSRSAPARVASFMAGQNRGAYFPFEIGDEVVAGFIDGHLDQCVILGGLHSDQDPPPEGTDTSDSNTTRRIVSREGSELTFDDTLAATKLVLKSAGGMEISLDDGAQTLTVKFDASNFIEMSPAGITVTGTVINLNP